MLDVLIQVEEANRNFVIRQQKPYRALLAGNNNNSSSGN